MNIEAILKYISIIISPTLAFCAFIVAYLTFKRHKTLENENDIFKHKLNKYYKILKQLHELSVYLENETEDLYEKYRNKEISLNQFDLKADKIDKEIDRIQDEIFVEYLLLPNKIINKIDECLNLLYDTDNYVTDVETFDGYKKSQIVLNKLVNSFDGLHAEIRDDIGIDVLDGKLRKRTRK